MKMKHFIPMIALMAIFAIGCKTAKKVAEPTVTTGEKPKVHKYFSVDQGPCFGRCAVYDIVLLSDSTLRLNGKNYTNYIGHYSKKLSGREFDSLLALYKAVKLDTFRSEYNNGIVDLSSVTYYFYDDYNKVVKKIFTQGLYPDPLNSLSSAMSMHISKLGWERDNNADTVNPDELIVQVNEGVNIQDIVDENWRYRLFIKEELSRGKIYLLGFDKSTIEQDRLINVLKTNKGVMFVEKNNRVELRNR